jgi:starvation-inducible DNA-binding protein
MESKSQNNLGSKTRETLAKVIDHVLQEECSLAATTRAYRWSVTGPNLYSLHRLFDEQRRQLDHWVGQVVQLAKSAGFGARANLNEAGPTPDPKKASGAGMPPRTMIGDLLARHEEMAHRLREDISRLGDPATAELLTRLVEYHETSAWMLRMVHNGPGSDQTA